MRVFEEADHDSKQRLAIPDTNVKFFATATVLDLGLRMLEHPAGKSGLDNIGGRLVKKLKDHEHIYDKTDKSPRNRIPEWTSLFLARLRGTFPNVILTNHMGGEGQVQRANWADPASASSKMLQWDPTKAGAFKLNKFVSIFSGNLAPRQKFPPHLYKNILHC